MRRCEYCGAQYSDKVSICPADGQPTINPHAQSGTIFGGGVRRDAFKAKIVSPMKMEGGYLIFVQSSDLIFIQIESASSHALSLLLPVLGPLGGVVSLFGWLFSRGKVNDFNERLHSTAPEILLDDSKKNFRLSPAEIRQVVIEPAAATTFSKNEVGRIILTIRQGEILKLVFAERANMDAVWQQLATGFFVPLQADLEWNAKSEQYDPKPPVKNVDQKNKLH